MSEWQPIETAPRDGTEILTWGYLHDDGGPYHPNGMSRLGEMPMMQISAWATEIGFWYSDVFSSHGHAPTHWMPLPPPPTNKAKG